MSNLSKFAASQFYIHSSNTRFYYKIYQYIENWITQNIFREDSSRVFLASNEYAFRRRFELTDMNRDYKEMEASALRFPFANYWPLNSGWEPDTRTAANPANALYQGIYVGDTQIRVSMVKTNIPITFYFDREDDARMAYDMLSFFIYNEHYGSIDIVYASSKIESPVSLKIADLKFNPQFKESDWLKQNRIFTIACSFEIRTFMFYPPKQPNYEYNIGTGNQLYDSNGNPIYDDEGNILKYNDGSVIFPISEEVILNFQPNVILDVSMKDQEDKLNQIIVSYKDLYDSSFEDPHIYVDMFKALPCKDYKSARITWILNKESQADRVEINLNYDFSIKKYLIKDAIKVENVEESLEEFCYEVLEDERIKYSILLNNLQPESLYAVDFTLFNSLNGYKKIYAGFTTEKNIETILPEDKKAPANALVGIKW